MQRGHKRCISTGTDARIGGTVKVRVKHVIDRGRRVQSARHLVPVLVSEGSPTQDRYKKQRKAAAISKGKAKEGIE